MKNPSINCPVEMTMQLIGDKWKVLIIAYLLQCDKEFYELKKCIEDIPKKILENNLKILESLKLIKRNVHLKTSIGVEYSLTDLGVSLKPIIDAMEVWGKNYKKDCEKYDDFIKIRD
ncbi:winged helix-turn-helix transcriptional regulator [Clostridium tyrobutyricum]|jgi:DNA-binding HxlR family transcriptional regulator|uniref:winged helix-turn-helix transcriptional regulator n=1 Tax=Clostridium tyrobutyricum TaxID=1519 RepID=UPI0002DB7E41|nr:helix-turn-helix domain-containing protein [Clostridium tyrobutyricum]MEA5009768.1 helix-turn-helix domain-containing protein [Clostridium tyrobutyricum]